jgi:hypothetical protein
MEGTVLKRKTCCIIGYKDIPAEKLDKVWRALLSEIDTALDEGCRLFVTEHTKGIGSKIALLIEPLRVLYPEILWNAVLPALERVIPFDRVKKTKISQYYTTTRLDIKLPMNYALGVTRFLVGKSSRIITVCSRDDDHETAYAMDYAKGMGLSLRTIYF